MTAWDRIQRQDLELRQAHRRIALLEQLLEERTAERDLARRVAVILEQAVSE